MIFFDKDIAFHSKTYQDRQLKRIFWISFVIIIIIFQYGMITLTLKK